MDTKNRLVVVIMPPCPSPPLFTRAMHTFRLWKYFGLASCRSLTTNSTPQSSSLRPIRQAPDQIEVEARTTRQHLPVLIFDELEYEPFTENRRWPSGKMKIARLGPPATPRKLETLRACAPSSRSGLRAEPKGLS